MRYVHLHDLLAVVLLGGLSGCAGLEAREGLSAPQEPLPEIPGPVCTVLERLTAGGQILTIKQKKVDGEFIYHVEARVGEEDLEFDITGDGTVLATGERVSYTVLPRSAAAAVRRCFGAFAGARVCKELEDGEVFCKAKGKRKGKAVMTLKLTDAGRIVEKEKS